MEARNYLYNLGLSFQSIAEQHADKTALQFPGADSYTFRALDEKSNQLARFLLSTGLKKGDVIAIFNEKSYLGYSLIIAALKIGVIYTNLDNTSPWPRLHKILGTCNPSLVFFDTTGNSPLAEFRQDYPAVKHFIMADETFGQQLGAFENTSLPETLQVHGADPSYIMFTSGSTGFPKGAVMSHNNVLNFIQWGRETFNVTAEDVFTNANPIYFDNSVFDLYTSLFNGATLVPLSHNLVRNARELVQAINSSNCTIWFSVPSLLVYLLTTKALTKNDFKSVKRISFGGEGFPKNKLKQLYEMFSDRMTLFNVYGPTECTCICSSYIIGEQDFVNMNELAPLGFIAPNFGYEILPLDEATPNFGELALIGPCVGLGYYNDKERTAKSFVQNLKANFTQLMYKTGDVVEKAGNGYLHFKGRVDNQIKYMGYRIELEEIEAAFSTLHYINEAGVIYEKVSEELGHIKAFVSVAEARESKLILNDIKNLLPPYMIPKHLVILDQLPKNANGKIDRKQLAQLKS
jgi:D-alanine--poly(phosphoribitol) ligase subunit 1